MLLTVVLELHCKDKIDFCMVKAIFLFFMSAKSGNVLRKLLSFPKTCTVCPRVPHEVVYL